MASCMHFNPKPDSAGPDAVAVMCAQDLVEKPEKFTTRSINALVAQLYRAGPS